MVKAPDIFIIDTKKSNLTNLSYCQYQSTQGLKAPDIVIIDTENQIWPIYVIANTKLPKDKGTRYSYHWHEKIKSDQTSKLGANKLESRVDCALNAWLTGYPSWNRRPTCPFSNPAWNLAILVFRLEAIFTDEFQFLIPMTPLSIRFRAIWWESECLQWGSILTLYLCGPPPKMLNAPRNPREYQAKKLYSSQT